MNIVTIMNYQWSNINHLAMCLCWIRQASLWLKPEDTCFVFSRRPLHPVLLDLMRESKTCQFKSCVTEGFHGDFFVPQAYNSPNFHGNNIKYKLYVVCHIDFPFVFIDADAFIVGELQGVRELFSVSQEVIFIDHEKAYSDEKGFPLFINSGVFVSNDVHHKVLNWEKIYTFGKSKNFIFYFPNSQTIIPGSDQSLLHSYLTHNLYDYRHPDFDNSYNCYAKFVNKISKDSEERWKFYVNGKTINIVHYWYEPKPWDSECPIFKEAYDEVLRRDSGLEQA